VIRVQAASYSALSSANSILNMLMSPSSSRLLQRPQRRLDCVSHFENAPRKSSLFCLVVDLIKHKLGSASSYLVLTAEEAIVSSKQSTPIIDNHLGESSCVFSDVLTDTLVPHEAFRMRGLRKRWQEFLLWLRRKHLTLPSQIQIHLGEHLCQTLVDIRELRS
jgi:hypothetical protein